MPYSSPACRLTRIAAWAPCWNKQGSHLCASSPRWSATRNCHTRADVAHRKQSKPPLLVHFSANANLLLIHRCNLRMPTLADFWFWRTVWPFACRKCRWRHFFWFFPIPPAPTLFYPLRMGISASLSSYASSIRLLAPCWFSHSIRKYTCIYVIRIWKIFHWYCQTLSSSLLPSHSLSTYFLWIFLLECCYFVRFVARCLLCNMLLLHRPTRVKFSGNATFLV